MIIMMHLAILCFVDMYLTHDPMSCTLHPVVTNVLQEFDAGMESRTTPIQEGGG